MMQRYARLIDLHFRCDSQPWVLVPFDVDILASILRDPAKELMQHDS